DPASAQSGPGRRHGHRGRDRPPRPARLRSVDGARARGRPPPGAGSARHPAGRGAGGGLRARGGPRRAARAVRAALPLRRPASTGGARPPRGPATPALRLGGGVGPRRRRPRLVPPRRHHRRSRRDRSRTGRRPAQRSHGPLPRLRAVPPRRAGLLPSRHRPPL
ncbi:MAG: hypothetical protein AVDCRST_MAG06-2854, partial [uncultured Nocardioides sp.]